MVAGLAPVIPGVGLIIWRLGFAAHPHQVAHACLVAAIFAAIVVFGNLIIYRIRMKRASAE